MVAAMLKSHQTVTAEYAADALKIQQQMEALIEEREEADKADLPSCPKGSTEPASRIGWPVQSSPCLPCTPNQRPKFSYFASICHTRVLVGDYWSTVLTIALTTGSRN